jgi:hypothetical protein
MDNDGQTFTGLIRVANPREKIGNQLKFKYTAKAWRFMDHAFKDLVSPIGTSCFEAPRRNISGDKWNSERCSRTTTC